MNTTPNVIVALSATIDAQYPPTLDPEAHRWRRCMKVSEEAGEVVEALLGIVGENPRKGNTHTHAHLRKELLDVAVAALGAVAYVDGNRGNPIDDVIAHATFVLNRLNTAIEGPPPVAATITTTVL